MNRKIICCFKPGPISYYGFVPSDIPRWLAEYGFDFVYCDSTEEFVRNLGEAEIAIAADFKPEWIRLAPRLKWVAGYAAGRERIDEAALTQQGIVVSFGRFQGLIMAETVIGMMLFACRGLGIAHSLQKQVPWCDTLLYEQVSTLRGKTCLILGLGQIGQHIARLTKAFGMVNIGIKRSLEDHYPDMDQLDTMENFEKYLPQADHLVIVLPNKPELRNMIGSNQLARMKPTACLHNVGRGICIDEAALVEALKTHRIHWACLDVFQTEPLPLDSPLRTLDNILILPHSSAFTAEYFELFFEEFQRDFLEYIRN